MISNQLNSKQLVAVNHIEGPALVLAGAGSGKTKVVTQRIAHLIGLGILPTDILAVTFTNKAANEMKERVKSLTKANILTCTFHSLGARILRESIDALGYKKDFTIYDAEDSLRLLKNCFKLLNVKDEKGLSKAIRARISSAKNDLLSDKEIDKTSLSSPEDFLFYNIYPLYQTKLREYNAVDFDDLLFLPVRLFKENKQVCEEYQNRWLFLLIDEYQDTNIAQYTLAKTLAAKNLNIFVVGDPDQSIYSWRGAKYQNILNFDKDFPKAKIINLEQNYRSTNTILEAANDLIKNNEKRLDKKLWSSLGEGEKISLYISESERTEAEFVVEKIVEHHFVEKIPLDDIAIFYRTNAQSRIFEDHLISQKLPYMIYGGLSFYQRREIKDVLSFLKMILSDFDFISFARTINIPKRKIGPASIAKLLELSEKNNLSILQTCKSYLEHAENFSSISLSKNQKEGLLNYITLIFSLRSLLEKNIPLSEIVSETIIKSNYLSHLKEEPDSFEDRKENLDALVAKAQEYEEIKENSSLNSFLEEISLLSNLTEADKKKSIKLMSLHNSKGLEFSLAFIVGMEEDIFPHINSKSNIANLEEERRLCYVGMTRAKKKLYLCASLYRHLWGACRVMQPSRFLREIPKKYLEDLTSFMPYPTRKEENLSSEESFSEGTFTEGTSTESSLYEGCQVIHKTFGIGIIKKIYQTSMGETYDVHFEASSSTKSLVGKYAKLKRF